MWRVKRWLTLLFSYCSSGDAVLIALGTISAMSAGIGYLAFDYLMWSTIGTAMGSTPSSISHTLVEMGYFLAAIAIALLFFSTFSDWLLRLAASRRCDRIRKLLVTSMLNRNIDWFESQPESVHEFFLFFRDSVQDIETGIGSGYQQFVFFVSICVGGFIVCFVFSTQLSLVLLGTMPLIAVGMAIVSRYSVLAADMDEKTFSLAARAAMKSLREIKTVLSCQQEKRELSRFDSLLLKSKSIILRTAILTGIGQLAAQGMAVIDIGIGLFFMASVTENGTASPVLDGSTLVWVLTTMIYGGLSLGYSTEGLVSMAKSVDLIDKMRWKYLRPSVHPSSTTGRIRAMDFDRLDLRAPDISITKSERVALVAINTYDRSVFALSLVDQLEALIGIDAIAFVGNEPGIINGTVRDNLLLGLNVEMAGTPSDDELIEVLNCVGLCKFLNCLPNKLDAIIKRGDYPPMSLAQERQICLARSLLRRPLVLIVDRVTEGLSEEDARILELALATTVINDDLTVITVPSGYSGMSLFDKIFVIDNTGSVCQEGSHVNLVDNKNGLYVYMLKQNDPELLVVNEIKAKTSLSGSDIGVPPLLPHISEESLSSLSRPSVRRGTAIVNRPLRFVENKKFSWPRILALSKESYNILLPLGAICSCLVGAIPPIVIYVLSQLTESFDTKPVFDNSKRYMLLLFLLGGGMAAASFAKEAAYGRVREKTVRDVRLSSMRHILHQPVDMYEAGNSPESVMSSLWRKCYSTGTIACIMINSICECVSWFIVAVAISFAASWKVAALSVSSMIALLIAYYVFFRYLPNEETSLEISCALIGDGLLSIRTIKTLRAEQHLVALYDKLLSREQKSRFSTNFILALFSALPFSICPLLTSFGFWYAGVIFEKTDGLTVPDIILTTYAVGDAGELAMNVISWLPDFSRFQKDTLKVFDLLDNDFSFDKGELELEKFTVKKLAFHRVSFAYSFSTQTPVLKQVSFEAVFGEIVGLVGPLKSGKSSVMNLIQRFYDPQYGKVTVNGINVRDFTIDSYRDVQAYIPQQPVIMDGTYLENLEYGRRLDLDTIEKISSICGLYEFVSDWNDKPPQKLSTCHAQRISIARALAREPEILLMDDPFALISDTAVSDRIKTFIESSRWQRITIIATSNCTCVQNANKIYVIDSGSLVQSGTYNELMNQSNQIFFKMSL